MPTSSTMPTFFVAMISLFLAITCSGRAHAFMFEGKQVSEMDIRALPPVCKLILIERRGAHHGGGEGPLANDAPLFSRQGYEMGAKNPHLHHYCWSILHKFEYFRARTTVDRDRRYREVISDINYVIENTKPGWPYLHIMFVEQATMMLFHRNFRGSLLTIDKALQLNPNYDRAYAVKSDAYVETGDKKAAIKALQEGLEKVPASPLLRKRLKLLGAVPPPLPEPKITNMESESDNTNAASLPEGKKSE